MSKPFIGARVLYCGHDAYFIADIFLIEGVNVVRTVAKIDNSTLIRPAVDCTHHLKDYPQPGFWRPDLGVFVVPKEQVKKLK